MKEENQVAANENLGIENAKPLARDLGEIITSLVNIDANNDGKIVAMEAFAIIQLATVKVVSRYSTAKEALAEIKDADSNERKELLDELATTFDLDNDAAEQLIEAWLYWINEGAELISNTIQILKPSEG